MQPSFIPRAAHTPLIRFIGSRAKLWKDAPHPCGPHVLTPANLVKHVAKPSASPAPKSSKPAATNVLEFGQLPARYRRAILSEAEMEAIESGGATAIF